MDKQERLVTVEVESIDILYSTLPDFIKELNNILYSIPEEYKDSSMIEHDIFYDYGEKDYRLLIYYRRPETKEEKELRLSKEAQIKEERRQQYLRLKREFENG